MAYPARGRPLSHVGPADRIDYLKGVAGLTLIGLLVSGFAGLVSAITIAPLITGQWAMLGVIFGSYAVAHYVAPRMVFGSAKWAGFLLGATFQGVAMGYLLLFAVILSQAVSGNPFLLIGQAMGLTALAGVGILAYLWSGPQELSLVRAGLSAFFVPMLILMVVTAVFPIGGVAGVGISVLFVLVSVAGLLYQTNQVLHQYSTDMKIEGAYTITMGVLILFWNLLSLIMALTGRD